MRRRDWTLLVLALAQGRGLSPVQLQKSLFLLGKNLQQSMLGEDFYHFEPYNYGPFDVSVYQDAEALAEQGLVSINRSPERRWALYSVTPDGEAAAEQIRNGIRTSTVEYVAQIVRWTQKLDFRSLVKAIYARYPEYRARSVFQG